MASNTPSGNQSSRDASVQGSKVKFLINIPLKVDSVTQAQLRYGYLLSNLEHEGFKEEDKKFRKEKNGKEVLEDVTVIFGMNGKHTPELAKVLEELKTSDRHMCKINYSIVTYTWGKGGTIAPDVPEGRIPYRDIRERLKKEAGKLVEELRGNDPDCLLYFSFVDSDTVKFNEIYSEYLQIVREELNKDFIPPTIMSTGYEFPHDDENYDHWVASRFDREVRTAIAAEHPLLVYYPEPNFCVQVRKGLNTIEESFEGTKRRKGEYSMESAALIRQLKDRKPFKAVFESFSRKPIIIMTPERFKVRGKGLITGQSHLDSMNMATGAMANMGITVKKATPTWFPECRGAIMKLCNCKDEKEFDEECKKVREKENVKTIDEKEFNVLIKVIKEARAYKQFVQELLKKESPESYPEKKRK